MRTTTNVHLHGDDTATPRVGKTTGGGIFCAIETGPGFGGVTFFGAAPDLSEMFEAAARACREQQVPLEQITHDHDAVAEMMRAIGA